MAIRVFVHLNLEQLSVAELEALIQEAQALISKRNLPPLNDQERALMLRPIEAIQLYRTRTGCGLMDAKNMVDRARRGTVPE